MSRGREALWGTSHIKKPPPLKSLKLVNLTRYKKYLILLKRNVAAVDKAMHCLEVGSVVHFLKWGDFWTLDRDRWVEFVAGDQGTCQKVNTDTGAITGPIKTATNQIMNWDSRYLGSTLNFGLAQPSTVPQLIFPATPASTWWQPTVDHSHFHYHFLSLITLIRC